jgi:ABC-type molybdenum transport system ATPase subunit/photorepair protein PhrA
MSRATNRAAGGRPLVAFARAWIADPAPLILDDEARRCGGCAGAA